MDLYEELGIRKILLVDEDPWVRDALSLYFRSKGCRLIALESVAQAVAAIALDRFDVVLCNHWPPETDGVAFLARVGNVQPDAITVLLTFVPAVEYAGEPDRARIDDVIQKPLTVENVESSLKRLIGGRSGNGDMACIPDVPEAGCRRDFDGGRKG